MYWPGGLHFKLVNWENAVELFHDNIHYYDQRKQKKTLASMSRIEELHREQKKMGIEGRKASLDYYVLPKMQLG